MSEASVLWLPVPQRPLVSDFQLAGGPGADGFHYYALDAFSEIRRRRASEFDREPWVYVLSTGAILSSAEIDQLMDEFEVKFAEQTANDPKRHP